MQTTSTEVLYQFETKDLEGEALKSVWTTTLPHHKQPVDSESVLAQSYFTVLSIILSTNVSTNRS
jgi:hypothetical protein